MSQTIAGETPLRESKLGRRRFAYIDIPLKEKDGEAIMKHKSVTKMKDGVRYSIYISTPKAVAQKYLKAMRKAQRALAKCVKSGKTVDVKDFYIQKWLERQNG